MLTLDDLEPRRVGRLWLFPDGSTLPVVAGGADDDASDDGDGSSSSTSSSDGDVGDADDDGDDGDDEGDDEAGRAVDWKHRARQWERRAKKNAKRLEELEQRLKGDGEKAIDEARKTGAAEAYSKLAGRLFVSELRELAKDRLAVPMSLLRDPSVALAMLELDELPVDEDGEVDREAVEDAIEALLKREPDLARKSDDGARPKGRSAPKAPSGPRGGAVKALEEMDVDDFRKRLRRRGDH